MDSRALGRLDTRIVRLFAADCAERVLPLYERRYPGDNRLRQAVDAARRYASGGNDSVDMGLYWESARGVARYLPKDIQAVRGDSTDYMYETLAAVTRAAVNAAGNWLDITTVAGAAVRAVYCNAQIGARPDIPSRATPAGMPGDYEVCREREWQAQRLSELRREFNRRRYERRQLAYSQIDR